MSTLAYLYLFIKIIDLNSKILFLIAAVLLLVSFKNGKGTVSVNVKNPTGQTLKGYTADINDPVILKKSSGLGEKISVQTGKMELPFQLIKENGDVRKLLVLCDLKPGEEKKYKTVIFSKLVKWVFRWKVEIFRIRDSKFSEGTLYSYGQDFHLPKHSEQFQNNNQESHN